MDASEICRHEDLINGSDIMTFKYAINAETYVRCKRDMWIFMAFA